MITITLAILGITIAALIALMSEREADDYYDQGMRDYHAKMREIHGDRYKEGR